jgi:hypothetical protein
MHTSYIGPISGTSSINPIELANGPAWSDAAGYDNSSYSSIRSYYSNDVAYLGAWVNLNVETINNEEPFWGWTTCALQPAVSLSHLFLTPLSLAVPLFYDLTLISCKCIGMGLQP